MSGIISALIILCSILLVLIVLVQNSKGGGLSSTFASSNQVMGVRKTADFLEKATWTLAGVLVVLCLVASAVDRKPSQQRNQAEATEQTP
jgi:preprotein translocase subunit SecG